MNAPWKLCTAVVVLQCLVTTVTATPVPQANALMCVPGNGTVQVRFLAATAPSAVLSYSVTLQYANATEPPLDLTHQVASAPSCATTFGGLSNTNLYRASVVTKTTSGLSAPATCVASPTVFAPADPTAVAVARVGVKSVLVSWASPAGMSTVGYFSVELSNSLGPLLQRAVAKPTTSVTVSNLPLSQPIVYVAVTAVCLFAWCACLAHSERCGVV